MKLTPEQQDAHDQLLKMAQGFSDESAELVDSIELPKTPTGSTPEQAGTALRRGAVFGKLEEGGPGADPHAGEPAPKGEPFTVAGEVGKLVTGAAQPRKPDLTQPLGGFAPPPGAPKDAELSSLQQVARRMRGDASVGQAVTDFAERPTNFLDYAQRLGGGGVSAAPRRTDVLGTAAAEGDRMVDELGDRRKSEAGLAASATAAAQATEKRDPNSQTAQTYRRILSELAPNVAADLEGANAEQMEKMVPWLENFAKQNAEALQAKAKSDEAKAKTALHEKERGEDLEHRKQTHADSQANAAATRDLARASFEQRKMEADRAQEARDQAGAQHLGDAAGGGQTMATALDDIDKTLAADPNAVPGKLKSTLTPDFLKPIVYSDNQMRVENDARDVMAVLLNKRSGAAVNKDEYERYVQMYGLSGDEKQFAAGMGRMRRDAAAELAARQAGVSQGAKEKFRSAGGKLAEDVAPKASGSVEITDKKGQRYVVPPAEAEALRAELRAERLL